MGATCCHILKRRKHSRCSSCCQARWGESTWFIHCHWNERFLKKRFLKSRKPAGPAQHICDGPMSYMLKEKKTSSAPSCPLPGIWGWSSQHPGKACSMEVRSLCHSNSCLLSLFICEDSYQEHFMISWPQSKNNHIFSEVVHEASLTVYRYCNKTLDNTF